MLELIGSIVLGYYLVLGVALLIFLALGFLDECRCANRRRRETRTGRVSLGRSTREPEYHLPQNAKQSGPPADNVVKFKRGK